MKNYFEMIFSYTCWETKLVRKQNIGFLDYFLDGYFILFGRRLIFEAERLHHTCCMKCVGLPHALSWRLDSKLYAVDYFET